MKIPRTFSDFPSAYQSFDQMPDRLKLSNYEKQFEGRDVWQAFLADQYPREECSEANLRAIERAGDRWKNECREHGRHHACASPTVVNCWCKELLETMIKKSANKNYLSRLNIFYRYLMWNIDYPHCYNPIQFAVQEYDTVAEIWNTNPV